MNVKENRLKLNLTQQQLADKIDVSVRTVQGWEQNRSNIGKIRLKKLNILFEGINYGKKKD